MNTYLIIILIIWYIVGVVFGIKDLTDNKPKELTWGDLIMVFCLGGCIGFIMIFIYYLNKGKISFNSIFNFLNKPVFKQRRK